MLLNGVAQPPTTRLELGRLGVAAKAGASGAVVNFRCLDHQQPRLLRHYPAISRYPEFPTTAVLSKYYGGLKSKIV